MRLKFHRNRQNNWKTHPIHIDIANHNDVTARRKFQSYDYRKFFKEITLSTNITYNFLKYVFKFEETKNSSYKVFLSIVRLRIISFKFLWLKLRINTFMMAFIRNVSSWQDIVYWIREKDIVTCKKHPA